MQRNETNNNLKVQVDWLEFTIHEFNTPIQVFNYLGLIPTDFEESTGKYGYRKSLKHICEPIYILYDGTEDMGIHIRVTGSAIDPFLNYLKYNTGISYSREYNGTILDNDSSDEKIFSFFINKILSIDAKFTRIDLAIDDVYEKYFSCSQVQKMIENGQCVSKFKSYNNQDFRTLKGEKKGHTIYFGSRQSDTFLRIYDKALEQKSSYPWVRWELEIKHAKADRVAHEICQRQSISAVAFGILQTYIRFINIDNNVRSRCSTNTIWLDFLANSQKIALTLPKKELSVDRSLGWLNKQVKPTLAGLVTYFDGDASFIFDDLSSDFNRLSPLAKALYLNDGKTKKGNDDKN
ncbi:replication initiation factor domain-containing protein [Anaerostipes sp.]|uniref:replication initiation factor domain-containing protein n=1 Tax=Anaerostipes sp. TaxID=1872530 RepID=UPI0025C48623|nr:replication initiation factor domain-containing protein [Anaerostipes sp.]MBS7007035.1 replication initiation factor domain-containing protein [Anaerostipes sp.]